MRFRKVYGQSKIDKCPFCGKQSVTENPQGVPVCLDHKEKNLHDMKCICGEWLDVKKGKYGVYFNCMRCGNVNYKKAMEANPDFEKKAMEQGEKVEGKKENKWNGTRENIGNSTPYKKTTIKATTMPEKKKEIFITSDDVDLFYS